MLLLVFAILTLDYGSRSGTKRTTCVTVRLVVAL